MIKKGFKLIKKCIFWLIFGIFLIFFCYFVFCKIILKQNFISIFGYGGVIVASNSMSPEIKIDDFLFVKKFDDYQVGDVIAFESDNKIITHRIISKTNKNIITKGDQNTQIDDPITENQILGKIVGKNNTIGAIILIVQSPIFWLVAIVTFLVFVTNTKFSKSKN